MRRVVEAASWPDSWKYSYTYDLQEIYGEQARSGYANAYRTRRSVALSLMTSALPPGARILDIAAAQGNFTIALAELGYDVTWNDLRADLAQYVQLKHERGTIHYAPGNVFELVFDRAFDGVMMTEVIEHVAHPDALLAKAATLVRPGGCIVMTTPNGGYFRNTLPRFSDCDNPAEYEAVQFKPNADGHIFLLHHDEVQTLATRASLDLDALTFFTNPLTHGHLRTESLLRLLPTRLVDGMERIGRHLPRRVQRACLIQMAARFRKPGAECVRS